MDKKSDSSAAEQMISELRQLRTTIREAGEAFILRKEGEIETLTGYLTGLSNDDRIDIARTWLRELRASTFKPNKGRLKDLKKLDRLLEDLLDLIIESQSASDKTVPRMKRQSVIADRDVRAPAT